ncbi:MAG TPA: YggT family protein [Candidatus Sulfomarinibacteraceae bacterium]|nr:YggT family protein [Candidatus Sulfomarinibacteraceae bacterium]
MGILISLINLIYWVFWILILARVVLSFTQMNPYHPIRRTVYELTEPFLEPIRRFLPPMSGLDFSPLIALLLLEVIRRVLFEIMR